MILPYFLSAGAAGTGAAIAAFVFTRRRISARPFFCSTAQHATKVVRIAGQLKTRKSTAPLSLRKKAVSHEVPKAVHAKYSDEKIDVSDLDAILEIDVENRFCVAESGVTFVQLVEATMAYGLIPIIVPELKTITVGGAVSGCSIESMSFRYGGFHDTCLEYEVITAKGEILTCTPENENQHIFQMVHGTFGTLGIISKLKFRLIPSKPFVQVNYERFGSILEYQAAINRYRTDPAVDFLDGIIHSPELYVLSIGRLVDQAPYANRYDWVKIYYQSTVRRKEDYLRTPDYFFRYDRGVTNVHPKSALGRFVFGKFIDSSHLLMLANRFHRFLSADKPPVILDVFIPISKIEEFMAWYIREFNFFPLWCVPYCRVRDYEWILPEYYARIKDELFLDIAIYGMEQTRGKNYYRIMEEKLMEIGGIKTLISHNYFSEEEFWSVWNKAGYATVKQRMDPDNIFRDLYSKTCTLPCANVGKKPSGIIRTPAMHAAV